MSPGAPAPTGGWEQPEPSTVTFRPWPSPGAPQAGDGDGGYYDGIGVGVGQDWGGGPVPPASMAPALGGPDVGYLDGGDPDGGDPDGGPRRGARGGRSGSPGAIRPGVAWLGLVVVLAAAAFGGYKYLYEPRVNAPVSAGLKLPTDAPGGPNFDPALGKWQHIGNKNQDPAAADPGAALPASVRAERQLLPAHGGHRDQELLAGRVRLGPAGGVAGRPLHPGPAGQLPAG